MSEELYEEGFEDITNIDFSPKVITSIEEKYKTKYPKMVFKVMDVLNMQEIQTGSFNIVFDKATLDSILCGDNSGNNAQKMINEIYLPPEGNIFVSPMGTPSTEKNISKLNNGVIYL